MSFTPLVLFALSRQLYVNQNKEPEVSRGYKKRIVHRINAIEVLPCDRQGQAIDTLRQHLVVHRFTKITSHLCGEKTSFTCFFRSIFQLFSFSKVSLLYFNQPHHFFQHRSNTWLFYCLVSVQWLQ